MDTDWNIKNCNANEMLYFEIHKAIGYTFLVNFSQTTTCLFTCVLFFFFFVATAVQLNAYKIHITCDIARG